ncbi:MAG: hypothetical protein ACRC42_02545, partial [Mycoplasma sp.]
MIAFMKIDFGAELALGTIITATFDPPGCGVTQVAIPDNSLNHICTPVECTKGGVFVINELSFFEEGKFSITEVAPLITVNVAIESISYYGSSNCERDEIKSNYIVFDGTNAITNMKIIFGGNPTGNISGTFTLSSCSFIPVQMDGSTAELCVTVTCTTVGKFTLETLDSNNHDFIMPAQQPTINVWILIETTTITYHSDFKCDTPWSTAIQLDQSGQVSAYVKFTFNKAPSVGTLTITFSINSYTADIALEGSKNEYCSELVFTRVGVYYITSLVSDVTTEKFTIQDNQASNTIEVVDDSNPDPEESAFKATDVKYYSDSCTSLILGNLTLETNGKAKAFAKITFDKPLPSTGTLTGNCGDNCNAKDFALSSSGNVCMELEFSAAGNYIIKGLGIKNDNTNVIDVSGLDSKQITVEPTQEIAATTITYHPDPDCNDQWETAIQLDQSGQVSAYVKFTFNKAPSAGTLTITFSINSYTAGITLEGSKNEYCSELVFTQVGEYYITSLESTVTTEKFIITNQASNTIEVEGDSNPEEPGFKPSDVKYHKNNSCSSEISGKLTLENGKAEAYAEITFDKQLPSDDTLTGKCGTSCKAIDLKLPSSG